MVQDYIIKYEEIRKKIKALRYAMWMISWDSETEAPDGCFDERAKHTGILSEELYKISTSNEYVECIDVLYDNLDKLKPVMKHEITEVKRGLDKISKIPMKEYTEYSMLMATSANIWSKAKKLNDYSLFVPTLEKIIDYNRKYVKYLETSELKGYDVLLDEYEYGFTTKEYDEFFDSLKKELVPFVREVVSKNLKYNNAYESKIYPKETQIEFAKEIQKIMCYDINRGVMKESEHPFTSGVSSKDIRFTVHYYENNLTSSIYSAIHELGHATYEQQCDPSLDETFCFGGASMAMHESQSRFYENMIGRSKVFWETHFEKLKDLFPEQLANTSVEDFYKSVNKAECSLIRTEADELTYALHIMVRYEIEKKLIRGEVSVSELPKLWNLLIKEYLGIEVPSLSKGVLQDVHWASGLIGYFPTYALGSAYSAQIYNKMKQEIDVDKAIKSGTNKDINMWLKDKIHKYGASKYPKEIIKIATGEDFNPKYYINYLKEKYSKIYGI